MGSWYSEGMFGNGKSLWTDYKNGFGTPSSDEFWMGLDKVSQLTKTGRWELMFKAKWSVQGTASSRYKGQWAFAVYSGFRIDDESSQYKIHFGKRKTNHYFGQNDPFSNHNGAVFRTSDRNSGSCTSGGAWWHYSHSDTCYQACFNCAYSSTRSGGHVWYDRAGWLSADVTEMLMRKIS